MSSHSLVRLAALPLAILVAAALVSTAVGAEPSLEAARLDYVSHPDGSDYFALSLRPDAVEPVVGPRDIVVLFDTSATQAGPYRVEALEALNEALSNLAPTDQVHLIAVDKNAIPMTTGFAQPGSSEMAEALKKLDRRTPLGAGDMEKALTAAADSFPSDSTNSRAVIYIGEGTSRANLVGIEKLDELVARLAGDRIPVNSYVVGPRPDLQLMGVLAGQTGGQMISESEHPGADLAAAAGATVVWPTNVDWPEGFTVYPQRTPPLRSDRDSVVIGTYTGEGPFTIQMSVAGAGGAQELSWNVTPGDSNEAYRYLAELVTQGELDGGLSLPIRGLASLEQARDAIEKGITNVTQLARQALISGNLEIAEQLADEGLRRDPGNLELLAVEGAVARRREGAAEPAAEPPAGSAEAPEVAAGPGLVEENLAGEDDLNLIGQQPEPLAAEGAFARTYAEEMRLIRQVVQADVHNAVNQARNMMATNPEQATNNLKLTLDKVSRTSALDPEVRAQLTGVIQDVLREASRRTIEADQRRRERQEVIAVANERRRIHEDLLLTKEKVRQLMERFRSLMDEEQYVMAEEMAAWEARELVPDAPEPLLAAHYSRSIGYLAKDMALREARQKGVIDTLASVEKSHVPLPDEPPIVYPDAEVWRELSTRRINEYRSMSFHRQGNAEKVIEAALESPTRFTFIDNTLQEAVDFLKDYHEIEIQIDNRALEFVGLDPSIITITKDLEGISLRSALRLTLSEYDLTYVIQDEVLLITTAEESQTRLITKVYPVADLVLEVSNNTGGYGGYGGMGMGGFGGMGGYGGMGNMMGMGGMGMGMGNMMGMGGMGMGNMGMGMGMGNMGMGGMGMWSVPKEVVPHDEFRAFSVKDDLDTPAATDNASPAAGSTEMIQVEIQPDADPEVVWEEYFTTHEPAPAAVRDAVRRLEDDYRLDQNVRFEHILALIGAALRHGQPQPWMYEASALILQAQGKPAEEIERVLLSAVDFAGTPADLMQIGAYFARLGEDDSEGTLSRRALQLFHQVAELRPVWPEPYMLGLRVAQGLDDLEAIQWATLGILSQAWAEDQAYVWEQGRRASKATLERLEAEGKTEEAEQYLAALDQAIARDCVIEVLWTGEADVDLLVEEPSGTVCSLRDPRSTAGGVMLGDTYSGLGQEGTEGYGEVYACPQGFSGTYRVLLKRVWGNVTGGKVKVGVWNHLGTEDERHVCKWVSLKDDQAVVVFDLEDGRRKESLQQHQVAHSAGVQLAIGRQILAQQLAENADTETVTDLDLSRQLLGSSGGLVAFPFLPAGAVGYQPVIETLPEGANLMAEAVISADRRFVRISPQPTFSGISEVNVFNTSSGEGGTTGGGTGGMGYSGMGFGSSGYSGMGMGGMGMGMGMGY